MFVCDTFNVIICGLIFVFFIFSPRKYYMDVKRLEDAFDLSGADKPQRHYPTLKPVSFVLFQKELLP